MSSIALQFVSGECVRRAIWGGRSIPIEISPYGQIRRAEFVDDIQTSGSLPTRVACLGR
jgi:hypothetical protein